MIRTHVEPGPCLADPPSSRRPDELSKTADAGAGIGAHSGSGAS
jgi:hypothetical protein